MDYFSWAYLHLATVAPAFLLGSYLLYAKKGSPAHKRLGKIYMLLMLATAFITLFMSAQVGPALFGHFGGIHLLSILTLCTVPTAFLAAKKGHIRAHRISMTSLYVGGILIAGAFTFMPGRLMHAWVFG